MVIHCSGWREGCSTELSNETSLQYCFNIVLWSCCIVVLWFRFLKFHYITEFPFQNMSNSTDNVSPVNPKTQLLLINQCPYTSSPKGYCRRLCGGISRIWYEIVQRATDNPSVACSIAAMGVCFEVSDGKARTSSTDRYREADTHREKMLRGSLHSRYRVPAVILVQRHRSHLLATGGIQGEFSHTR